MTSLLTDHLRMLPDEQLATLIRLRPDLITPVPADFAILAARVQSRHSVARTLDGLDRFTLHILDALRLTRVDEVASIELVLGMTTPAGVPAKRVTAAVEELRRRCVVYGPTMAPRLVATVDEVCSVYLAGLGRPARELSDEAAALVADPAGLRRTLLAASPARAALDRLAAGPPLGAVSATSLARGTDSAVRGLVDSHLLVPVPGDAVELPREIGLLLRRDTGPLGRLEPDPPVLSTTDRAPAAVDQAGAGQAMELVRHTEAIMEALSTEPAVALRSGGLGVRDLRRLARAAGVAEQTAAILVEVAAAAGLLGASSGETGSAEYLPTANYDGWRVLGMASRWLSLASAWQAMTREPALVGSKDDRRPVSALGNEVERIGAPARRSAVLGILADLTPGAAVSADSVASALAWRTPRRVSTTASPAVDQVLKQAAFLGLTGLGALTGYTRLLLHELAHAQDLDEDPLGIHSPDAPDAGSARAALDQLLPHPVTQVLLQADLTVVVPGPPDPVLAAELALATVRESPSVFRLTPESVRRALDAGMSADDLLGLFARRSTTPVPQPVTYLIEDVSRQHGGMRVGAAGAYLRSADETLIAEVLASRVLTPMCLRRLAPTVVVTPYSTPRLLSALREAGYAPVAEDATGDAVLIRPKVRRSAPRPPVTRRRNEDPIGAGRLTDPIVAGVIAQIHEGEAVSAAARRAPTAVRAAGRGGGAAAAAAHVEAIAILQQALRDRAKVWIGYVDAHGTSASRLLLPISMGAGYLRAEDSRTETVHTLALHRITAAAAAE